MLENNKNSIFCESFHRSYWSADFQGPGAAWSFSCSLHMTTGDKWETGASPGARPDLVHAWDSQQWPAPPSTITLGANCHHVCRFEINLVAIVFCFFFWAFLCVLSAHHLFLFFRPKEKISCQDSGRQSGWGRTSDGPNRHHSRMFLWAWLSALYLECKWKENLFYTLCLLF